PSSPLISPCLLLSVLSSYSLSHHPHLHSFPTRRSSDLSPVDAAHRDRRGAGPRGPVAARANRPLAAPVALRARSRARGCRGRSRDRKSTRLNSSHQIISYAVFCLKKKKKQHTT